MQQPAWMSGEKRPFSADENRVLRAALRKLQQERKLSQQALGDLLGMTQQNAARLLHSGGMGRGTANALARTLGYRDAEHYLLELSIIEVPTDDFGGTSRDVAADFGRRLGYEPEAIDAVVGRYSDESTRGRPLKWWFTKFGDEERELAADRVPMVAQVIVNAPKQRKRL